MKDVIIGTAGHVDHGKTALIKALTGQNTDRLKEERERGISIDLGFASLHLGAGMTAGIVDVPGHERFLKNMLAGSGGIDVVLLVVAADEGVMPQTRDHLAMLELFGVRHGIIVISKIDKVDEAWLDLVSEEIGELVDDTFLAGAPVCRVSALTGEGLARLLEQIRETAGRINARDKNAPFRMWVDRVFTMKGYGMVVTGSVLSGAAAVGDMLQLDPLGRAVRVRNLEWHEQSVDRVSAGQRAAINLAGVDTLAVKRGMLLTAPERGETSAAWYALGKWKEPVKNGARIRLHIGTGEHIGRVYFPSNAPPDFVRIALESPLPGSAGERGIVRLYSPQTLLGGVILAAADAPKRQPSKAILEFTNAAAAQDIVGMMLNLLEGKPGMMQLPALRRKTGYVSDQLCDQVIKELVQQSKIRQLGSSGYVADSVLNSLRQSMLGSLRDFYAGQPFERGMPREAVRRQLNLDDKAFDAMTKYWEEEGLIVAQGTMLALPEQAAKYETWLQSIDVKAAKLLDGQELRHIDAASLAELLAIPVETSGPVYDMLVRAGMLVRVGELNVYGKTLRNVIRRIQAYLQQNGTVTAAELRDMLHTSRKVAIPVLEYCDMHKYTIRDGDIRRLGPKILA